MRGRADRTGRRAPRNATPGPPPRLSSALARFMLGTVAAITVIVAGGFFALRQVAVSEAERDTRERVRAEGRLVESAGLSDGILRGGRRAVERIDDVVQGQTVGGSIVRVKLWSKDGRILYSDEPALIGKRFGLQPEELHLFATGGADADVSDLSKPENRYERAQGNLLEAHTPIRTPNGTPVLFEIYQRVSSVNASGERLLGAFAPRRNAARYRRARPDTRQRPKGTGRAADQADRRGAPRLAARNHRPTRNSAVSLARRRHAQPRRDRAAPRPARRDRPACVPVAAVQAGHDAHDASHRGDEPAHRRRRHLHDRVWLGHEQERTTPIYLHADLALKQRTLDRITPPNGRRGRYRAPDSVIDFLDNL